MKIRLLIVWGLLCCATLAAPIHDAAESGDVAKLKEILSAQPNGVDVEDDDGETALMEAADDGRVEAVRFLIDHGAALEHQDKDGETALLEAAEEGHLEVVRLLLQKGAKINHQDRNGETALIEAVTEGKPECVEFLLQQGAALGALDRDGFSALELCKDDNIRLLLQRRGARPK